MNLNQSVSTISSREELANFVAALRQDLKDHRTEWQNLTLEDFLESFGAWVQDMDGYYLNKGLDVPVSPSWQNVAEMLLAAKFYE